MPLSEHEQRLLDQIEHALYTEDPKFAHAVRSTNPQTHYKRRIAKAVFGLVFGICVLMAGLVVNKGALTVAISVAGFLLMFASGYYGLSNWKRMTGIGNDPEPPRGSRGGRRQSSSSGGGLMHRLEERWRKRSDEE